MVAGADALTDPPHPFMAGDRDDVADDLVPGDAREGHRHDLTRANLITGPFAVRLWHSTRGKGRHRRSADTASENFDNDLASLGVLPGDGDSLELSPRCEEGVSGVSRRKFRKGWHRRRKNRVLLDCWSAELREGKVLYFEVAAPEFVRGRTVGQHNNKHCRDATAQKPLSVLIDV